jgi:hypothetical protein
MPHVRIRGGGAQQWTFLLRLRLLRKTAFILPIVNNFIVDGLSANDDAARLSGITYTVDAVDQFQVVLVPLRARPASALRSADNWLTIGSGSGLVEVVSGSGNS